MTRWHVDDPLSRFLDKFPDARIIRYPAVATQDEPNRKKGEPLFPELKSLAFLNELRKMMLFRLCLASSPPGGLIMEFGVSGGSSLRVLRHFVPPDRPVYGFDSFEGLPEAWNGHAVGAYASAPPQIEGVELVVGMFEDTLPRFSNSIRST